MKQPQFVGKGRCHGVNLIHRDTKDTHALVQVFTEDDGCWHSEMSFSSHWLPALIEVLCAAEKRIQRHGIKDGVCGYKLPHREVVEKVEQILEEEE